jgi:hypothetical protein
METKPTREFGKRRPVVPAVARPGPPAKRSGHVGLLLMGTLAVGGGAYALTPGENCERPPNMPSPSLLQGNAECPPRGSSSSSSHGSGGGSSRNSFFSGDSSSNHSASGTSSNSGSHGVTRGGFGSLAHAFTSHFSGGG